MSDNLNSSKLHAIVDVDSYENFLNLIDELEKLEFYVEKKEIGIKIVQIIPKSIGGQSLALGGNNCKS